MKWKHSFSPITLEWIYWLSRGPVKVYLCHKPHNTSFLLGVPILLSFLHSSLYRITCGFVLLVHCSEICIFQTTLTWELRSRQSRPLAEGNDYPARVSISQSSLRLGVADDGMWTDVHSCSLQGNCLPFLFSILSFKWLDYQLTYIYAIIEEGGMWDMGWLCKIELPTCFELFISPLIWSKRERQWSYFSLCSTDIIVAAYPASQLIKKFNALCFFLSLLVYRCFLTASWEDMKVLSLILRKGGLIFLLFEFWVWWVSCYEKTKESLRRR